MKNEMKSATTNEMKSARRGEEAGTPVQVTRRTAMETGLCALAAFVPASLLAGGCAVEETSSASGELRLPRSVAGIPIPASALACAAAELAISASPAFLYNHCLRTYLFAALLFEKRQVRYDRELVFVGAALHDLGLVEAFMSPTARFEVDGADAARRFMEDFGVPARRADIVWDAIAMHTSAGIVTTRAPEVAAVSLGAGMDVSGRDIAQFTAEEIDEVLTAFPRLGFKERMVEQFIELCRRKPRAQIGQFTAEIGRRHIPNFDCPTLEDVILAAPFPD